MRARLLQKQAEVCFWVGLLFLLRKLWVGRMVILKILNNNLVIAKNEDGHEVILRGKGIGFQKCRGQEIPDCDIERIFKPVDEMESRHFQELVSQIPLQYLTLSEQIVTLAREEIHLNVTDSILIPLCDHISGTVDRCKSGILLHNPMLWDIQRLYPKEYEMGLRAVALINEAFGIDAEEDEAAFLAFHFVNNQLNSKEAGEIQAITQLISEILQIVELCYQVSLDKDDLSFQRFVTHLKFFAQRLVTKKAQEDRNDEFFYMIKEKYPQVYHCSVRIGEFLHDKYRYELNQEEMLYLMLHIERVTRGCH